VYLLFVYPKIYFLFTSNFRNILFVYLVTALLYCYYLCIVLKILFVYLLKNTFYLQPRITCVHFHCQLRELFVYILKLLFMYLSGLHVAFFYGRLRHIRLSNTLPKTTFAIHIVC
jgi:hypothetical protein